MALLKEKTAWEAFFHAAAIPATECTQYAEIMHSNRITDPADLNKELLKELGITVAGDIISILKAMKEQKPNLPTDSSASRPRPTSVKAPELKSEMTHPEFRKYKIDWGVFKKLTDLPDDQVAAHIYNSCDSNVQNAIVNTSANFLSLQEEQLQSLLEGIVTKRSNPTVHRVKFSNIVQNDGELIKDYVVRLNSSAKDCEFACPSCGHDLQHINVKDQFIRGIHNSSLQTDILAKSETLTSLEDIIKHAEAFETALHDQTKLQDSSSIARISDYKRQNDSRYKKPFDLKPFNKKSFDEHNSTKKPNHQRLGRNQNPCHGCGKFHAGDRREVCPAYGR